MAVYSRSVTIQTHALPFLDPANPSAALATFGNCCGICDSGTKDAGPASDVLSIAELCRFSHDVSPFQGPVNIRVSIRLMSTPRLTDRLVMCRFSVLVILIALCLALVSGGRQLRAAGYCVCTSPGYDVHDLDNCPVALSCFDSSVPGPTPGR